MENNNLVIKKLNKTELNDVFCDFVTTSGFKIKSINTEEEPNVINIKDSARNFEIHFIIKNLAGAGWTDTHLDYKRIQVGNIKDKLVSTNKIRTHMICGLVEYKNEDILIVWNSYRYTTHKTNRSCYVTDSSIEKCYQKGYVMVNDFDQEIWLTDKKHFGLLIRDYISFNYIME